MLKIEFLINGKKTDPKNMKDALEAAVFKSVETQIAQKLRNVRCPEHGAAPTVVCEGRTLSELTFKVSGCCEKLTEATKAALR